MLERNEAVELLYRLRSFEDLVLVGGQAVAIWHDVYNHSQPEGVMLSKDIDLWANKPSDVAPV